MRIKLFLIITSLLASLVVSAQNKKYSSEYSKTDDSVVAEKHSKFEVGFHYGPAWTSGDVKEFAKSGGSFSLDLGANSGNFYIGTELTFTSWKDYVESEEASDLNFEDANFLWLVHAKIFMGEGKVKPYIGLGTDLITLGRSILEADEDDDDCYYSSYHEYDEPNYNAWIVPSFGIRWKMGPDVSGNIGFSANFSRNYDFVRLQFGIVF